MRDDWKPCAGCGVDVLWARHERTGKAAPIVPSREGEKPNIAVYYVFKSDEREAGWYYSIGTPKKTSLETPINSVNHFFNCPKAADFKRR